MAATPEVFAAGTSTAGKMCSICQTAVLAGERVVFCPDCQLPFHEDCWKENGGCSQYGCASAPATKKQDLVADFASTVWGDEKQCPNCGRKIKAKAMKCRFCRAEFESRDLISSTQYAKREYADKDYTKARNMVMAMFFLSATGCFSPVMAIVLAVLIFGKKCCGVDFNRLPLALKGLAVIAFGISCLLVFLGLLLLAFDS